MFVPLHVKSDGSAGYGTASIEELVRRTAENGWPAIAVSGRHALGDTKGRLVLLARDREGYESLCRIVTRRRTHAIDEPLACLEDHPRGVFFLSDDRDVTDALIRSGVHRDDIRFLLARGVEPPRGIRSVAAPDVVVLDPSDAPLHRLTSSSNGSFTKGGRSSSPCTRVESSSPMISCATRRSNERRKACSSRSTICGPSRSSAS